MNETTTQSLPTDRRTSARGKVHKLLLRVFLRALAATLFPATVMAVKPALVFQSDFGDRTNFASIMHAVANKVGPDLRIFDIRHNITPYNIREAARSLAADAPNWAKGTVFVSVVDPGVGTVRQSVVLKTKSGHYFVSPNNGSLSLVAKRLGIEAVRQIDEKVNRLQGSEESHTFHGRDVYAFTGARLAAGVITYAEVGPLLPPRVVMLDEFPPPFVRDGVVHGTITSAGGTFGNVGTNIPLQTFRELGLEPKKDSVRVTIKNAGKTVFDEVIPYVRTFGEVPLGKPLLNHNSGGPEYFMSLGLNQDDFAGTFHVASGPAWTLEIHKAQTPEEGAGQRNKPDRGRNR